MKSKELLMRAIELRTKGHSLREISEIFNISKSTASLWLRDVDISQKGKDRLDKIKQEAIVKSKTVKREKQVAYLKMISLGCSVLEKKTDYSKDVLKIFLALLFWCEGSKRERRLVFMNSDANLIKAYLSLLRNAYKIDDGKLKATLHLHEYHSRKVEVEYWSKVTGIREENIGVYNKENSRIRKKDGYRGCISIRYGDVRILDELLLIIERFSKYISAGVG